MGLLDATYFKIQIQHYLYTNEKLYKNCAETEYGEPKLSLHKQMMMLPTAFEEYLKASWRK